MIDWPKLHDAMGTAEAVPELLAALKASRKRQRTDAFQDLSDNRLVHQGGQRWPASLAAVPLLLAQLDETKHPGRTLVLDLLATIAVGAPTEYAAGAIAGRPLASIAADPGIDGDCYRAVASGADRYEGLLEHADPSVRAHAALPLVLVAPERAVTAITAKLASEIDEEPRVAWLLALGVAAQHGRGHPVLPAVTGGPAVSVAAAVARIFCGVEQAKGHEQAAALAPGLDEPLSKVATPFGPLGQVAMRAAVALGPPGVSMLAAAYTKGDGEKIFMAHALIQAAIPGADMMKPRVPLRPSRSFSLEALDIVRLVTKSSPDGHSYGPLAHLRSVGMPSWIPDLRRYLGIDPPGPLESMVSWRGAEVEAIIAVEALALGEASEQEVRGALLEGRSAEDRVAIALEAAENRYELDFRSPGWTLNRSITFAVSMLDSEAYLPALEARAKSFRTLGAYERWALVIATHRLRRRAGAPFLRDLGDILAEIGLAEYAREILVDALREILTDAPADIRDSFALTMPLVDRAYLVDKIRGRRVGPAHKGWNVLDLAADRAAAARRGVDAVAQWTALTSTNDERRPVEAPERALRALLPEPLAAFEAVKDSATPYGREVLEAILKPTP